LSIYSENITRFTPDNLKIYRGWIDRAKIPKLKLLKENNRRLRYLSKEESQRLIDACAPHLRPIVITALHTGMRKGEILSLTWDQVDMTNNLILLEDTKNGRRREIPINETLIETLRKIIRRVDVPYVFYDPTTGKPYQDVKRSFTSACRRAKITNFRFHDLRHTFASHLVMLGVNLATVRELLGHTTTTMTMRYAHLSQAHISDAVNKFADFLQTNQNNPDNIIVNPTTYQGKRA
jgi:integrase